MHPVVPVLPRVPLPGGGAERQRDCAFAEPGGGQRRRGRLDVTNGVAFGGRGRGAGGSGGGGCLIAPYDVDTIGKK